LSSSASSNTSTFSPIPHKFKESYPITIKSRESKDNNKAQPAQVQAFIKQDRAINKLPFLALLSTRPPESMVKQLDPKHPKLRKHLNHQAHPQALPAAPLTLAQRLPQSVLQLPPQLQPP